MKKLIIIIVLLGGSLFVSAQKSSWTIGLYSGMQIQLLTSIERNYTLGTIDEATGTYVYFDTWNTDKRTINRIYAPPMELMVRYNITDNFSVSSGIGYANYISQWKPRYSDLHVMNSPFALNTYWRKVSIQIPCNLRYDIRLKNTGFSIFPKLGLSVDFSANSYYHKSDIAFDTLISVNYMDKAYSPVFKTCYSFRKINLLINAGMGFAYQFKSGVGISLSGEYSVGTMRSESFNYNLQLKDPITNIVEYEYDYWIYNSNEYWNVLLGISYTFKKKNKE